MKAKAQQRWLWAGRLVLVGAVLALAGASALAWAGKKPAPYALIFGTVWMADSRPAAGVTVKIRLAEEKKARWELHSDSRGEFAQRYPPAPPIMSSGRNLKGMRNLPLKSGFILMATSGGTSGCI